MNLNTSTPWKEQAQWLLWGALIKSLNVSTGIHTLHISCMLFSIDLQKQSLSTHFRGQFLDVRENQDLKIFTRFSHCEQHKQLLTPDNESSRLMSRASNKALFLILQLMFFHLISYNFIEAYAKIQSVAKLGGWLHLSSVINPIIHL